MTAPTNISGIRANHQRGIVAAFHKTQISTSHAEKANTILEYLVLVNPPYGNVAGIIDRFGSAGPLRKAVSQLQSQLYAA
ncbi:MAG TPA: hypothetical protein VMR33_07655 [Candidatus Baltobacteraceae bacterium]|jgi:hypothetical protein|nr:hypothetical protein [Candidatus Baltobacteraceae bacterium]